VREKRASLPKKKTRAQPAASGAVERTLKEKKGGRREIVAVHHLEEGGEVVPAVPQPGHDPGEGGGDS